MPVQLGQIQGAPVAADTYTNGAGPSPGASAMATLQNQPTLMESWNIVAWSIALRVQLQLLSSSTGFAPHGRLGDIYAGLIVDVPQANDPPFPSDSSLVQQLFNGDSDPSPVWGPGPTTTMVASMTPPQPIKIANGQSLGIGVWILPGISPTFGPCQFEMAILSANYSVYYDDTQA